VHSGDFITIREVRYNGCPKTRTIVLNNVIAPKFGQRATKNYTASKGTDDEPYSWEAREFFSKKLIGKKVFLNLLVKYVVLERQLEAIDVFYPTLDNNIVNEIVENGLVTVKTVMSNNRTPYVQNLVVFQNKDKPAMERRWDPNAKNIAKKNNFIDDVESFFKKNSKTHIKAIFESVIEGTTMKLLLLPERNMILFYLLRIRCPPEDLDLRDEAKFFIEVCLLQKEVEVTLERVFYIGKIHLSVELSIIWLAILL